MGEQTTPLQQSPRATKIIDDGPLKVTDIEATTVKTDNLEANAGTEISVNDDIQVGNLDAMDIDTTDIVSTNQPQPWGIPSSNSESGTVPCGEIFIYGGVVDVNGTLIRRAGVYNFRVKQAAGDDSSHVCRLMKNHVLVTTLPGATAGNFGSGYDLTVAEGDNVAISNIDGATMTGVYAIQIRNADGWM